MRLLPAFVMVLAACGGPIEPAVPQLGGLWSYRDSTDSCVSLGTLTLHQTGADLTGVIEGACGGQAFVLPVMGRILGEGVLLVSTDPICVLGGDLTPDGRLRGIKDCQFDEDVVMGTWSADR